MTPEQLTTYIRERAGNGSYVHLSFPMACLVASAFEESNLLAGTLTVLASSPRYQGMTVAEAIEELYHNGMKVPDTSLAVLAAMEDEIPDAETDE